jgi:hypothetical protein
MTVANEEKKPDALAAAGASVKDIDEGQSTAGAPKAPAELSNEPPSKEGLNEKFDTSKEPAKEPAKEPVKEPVKEPTGPLKEYVTLDDPAGQGAIEVLKEAGLDPNEAEKYFAEAVKNSDIALVDWAGIESKIGKAKTFLVKSGVETYYNNLQAKTYSTIKTTHTIMGGESNWIKVRDWAKSVEKTDTAFAAKVDDIRDLLNEGGSKAEAGARELLRLYNSAPNTNGLNTDKLVVGESTGTVIGSPLTRTQYVAELKKAHEDGGNRNIIAALDARRKAGMAQGI